MSDRILTTAEAAELTGIGRSKLLGCIASGALPASDTGVAAAAGRPRYLIKKADLDAFLGTYQPIIDRKPWAEEDLAALKELVRDKCTGPQIAAYLGRTYGSVHQQVFRMKQAGEQFDSYSRRGMRLVPFYMPKGAILVARTCRDCGELRDGRLYPRANSTGCCYICRRGKPGNHNVIRAAKQEITLAQASNSHQPYTDDEIEEISDPERSPLELALKLHRTYQAICGVRERLRLIDKPQREYRKHRNSRWIIHFPNAAKALQEHFIRLGVPDDGWDEVA